MNDMVFNESRYDNKIIPKDNLSFCQNEGCENRIIREKGGRASEKRRENHSGKYGMTG